MRPPIDRMLDQVDFKCVHCNASLSAGCDCAKRERQASINTEYEQLMKLRDEDLMAECRKLGIEI